MAKKKVRRNVVKGIAHIAATFNNTIITITDMSGETLCWDSAGTVGFKGARKATPFAASRASAAKSRYVWLWPWSAMTIMSLLRTTNAPGTALTARPKIDGAGIVSPSPMRRSVAFRLMTS